MPQLKLCQQAKVDCLPMSWSSVLASLTLTNTLHVLDTITTYATYLTPYKMETIEVVSTTLANPFVTIGNTTQHEQGHCLQFLFLGHANR